MSKHIGKLRGEFIAAEWETESSDWLIFLKFSIIKANETLNSETTPPPTVKQGLIVVTYVFQTHKLGWLALTFTVGERWFPNLAFHYF